MKHRDQQILQALYFFSRHTIAATVFNVSGRLGVPTDITEAALMRLEAADMVDRDTCRLTLKGLMVAHSHHAARKASASLQASETLERYAA